MNIYERRIQFGFGTGLTPVVKKLLIANIAVYLIQLVSYRAAGPVILYYFALQPLAVISQFKIWQIVTYLFLHGNFFHIFFNLFALWMFGCEVERTLGSGRFLKFYFTTGVGAALIYLLFNYGSSTPVIGASGAIYGVLVAFALLFPERIVTLLLFFVLPTEAAR